MGPTLGADYAGSDCDITLWDTPAGKALGHPGSGTPRRPATTRHGPDMGPTLGADYAGSEFGLKVTFTGLTHNSQVDSAV
jgi:hypothetical protein